MTNYVILKRVPVRNVALWEQITAQYAENEQEAVDNIEEQTGPGTYMVIEAWDYWTPIEVPAWESQEVLSDDSEEIADIVKSKDAEIARLREREAQLEDGRMDLARLSEEQLARAVAAEARVAQGDQLAKAAKELYDDAGVDDIDPRLDYLMLQVSREAWNDFVAAVALAHPEGEQ